MLAIDQRDKSGHRRLKRHEKYKGQKHAVTFLAHGKPDF